jgi:hypothetical protein
MAILRARLAAILAICVAAATVTASGSSRVSIVVDTPMGAPPWARLERQVLDANTPAAAEFYRRYYDDAGRVQCVLRWGADDGPDDAFENFAGWPELHALGGGDDILRLYRLGLEGMLQQYAQAKTTDVPAGRGGMYYKEFSTQADWMHHGEGLRVFNRMGLSVPEDPTYQARARRFAGFYMGEDPEAPNYDPRHRIIRSLINGSPDRCCAGPPPSTGSAIRSTSRSFAPDTTSATSRRCSPTTPSTAMWSATPS